MSISRRIAFGGAASWVNRGLTVGLSVVLMPVLYRHLGTEELGLWLLMGQSWASMGIFDFGLAIALSRKIALAKGKSGSDPNCTLTDESRREIADLLASGQRMYRFVAFVSFALAWSLGLIYLQSLELDTVPLATAMTAWTILSACQAVNVWSTVWICLLEGIGYVGWESLAVTAATACTTLAQIVAILAGGGLVELAAIATMGALLQRTFMRLLARNRQPGLFRIRGRWLPDISRNLADVALRAWLTTVGGVLVMNTDTIFVASGLGATSVPGLRAAFLVVLNIHTLAGVFGGASMPYISHLWQAGDLGEARRVVERNLRIGLTIVAVGSAAILGAGDALFNVWLGSGNYAGWSVVALFCLMFVFEQQTYLILSGCRATGHEAFARWALAGGLLKLGLTWLLVGPLGLIGIPVATLLAQGATVYWYVPYEGLRRLGIGIRSYLTRVLAPSLAAFAVALALSESLVRLTPGSGDWTRLLASVASGGLVLLPALWFLALESAHRERALRALWPFRAAVSAE